MKHGQDGKKEFMVYLTASESKSKPDDVKTCRLLSAIGLKAREISYTFTFEEEDDGMKFDNVIERFDQYFTPKKNVTYMRFIRFSPVISQKDRTLMHT